MQGKRNAEERMKESFRLGKYQMAEEEFRLKTSLRLSNFQGLISVYP